MSAAGFYRTPGIHYDKARGQGKPFHYFSSGACVAEVEVDAWSGMKRVRRVDILHDVGDSLNAGVDRGHCAVEGGFVQGALVWLTGEELKWRTTRGACSRTRRRRIRSRRSRGCARRLSRDAPARRCATEHRSTARRPSVSRRSCWRYPRAKRFAMRSLRSHPAERSHIPLPSPAPHEAILETIRGVSD